MPANPESICTQCGACCAAFRVTFHYSELDSEPGGNVPARLADEETSTLVRMRGTDYAKPRCIALSGTIGKSVYCGIYKERPSPCREFGSRASIGIFEEACNKARAANGLPPLPVD